MQNGLLSIVKHLWNVMQSFCRALDAALHLGEVLHDWQNILQRNTLTCKFRGNHRSFTSIVEYSTKSTLLPTRTTGFLWSALQQPRINGSQCDVMRSSVSSSSTAYTTHTTWAFWISSDKVSSVCSNAKMKANKPHQRNVNRINARFYLSSPQCWWEPVPASHSLGS